MIEFMLSRDEIAPGVILPMYCFKQHFKDGYPEIWKHIEKHFIGTEFNKYGIRHHDEDWDLPIGITKLNFLVNRYGILFTHQKIEFGPYDIDINEEKYNDYYMKVERMNIDIPALVKECEEHVNVPFTPEDYEKEEV